MRETVEVRCVLLDLWTIHFAPNWEQISFLFLLESSSEIGAMGTKNIIGPQVRRIRDSKGMTQDALAAKCNLIGWDISRGTLAKIESQVRRITDDEVELLASALEVEINQLYADKG